MERLTARAWLVCVSFWTALGTVCGLQIYLSMLSHGHSLLRIVLYQVVAWNCWLPIVALVHRLLGRFPLIPARRLSIFVHLLLALSTAVTHVVVWRLLMQAMKPYDRMTPRAFGPYFGTGLVSSLPVELLVYVIVVASLLAFDFYGKFRDREVRAAQLEASLSAARLHALELQLQPHFLFNTLNAVSSLVRSARNDEAVGMIAGLSDLLRYSLDHAGDQRVSVEQETEILRRYLDIQRTRFADRLTYAIDVDDAARRGAVPMLILQPLAENAIRHGLSRSAAAGRIDLRIARDGAMLRIRMFNTGTLREPSGNGIGLRNTADRLRQLYGDAQRFELRSSDGGVVAEVEIPWSEVA